MNIQVFTAELGRLMTEFKQAMPQAQIDQWWSELRCVPGKYFSQGITKIIRTRDYPNLPTFGVVLKACIGDHYHMTNAVRRSNRDATPDEILVEYKKKWEEHKAQLAAPPRAALPVVEPTREELIAEVSRLTRSLEREKQESRNMAGSVIRVQAEYSKLETMFKNQGEALAKLEREWRGLRNEGGCEQVRRHPVTT